MQTFKGWNSLKVKLTIETILRHVLKKNLVCEQRNIRHLRDFVSMKDEDRRLMLRSLGDGEYRDIMQVCGYMPFVEMNIRSEGETSSASPGTWSQALCCWRNWSKPVDKKWNVCVRCTLRTVDAVIRDATTSPYILYSFWCVSCFPLKHLLVPAADFLFFLSLSVFNV